MTSSHYIEYMQKEAGLGSKIGERFGPTIAKAIAKAVEPAAAKTAPGLDSEVASIMARFTARHPGGIPIEEIDKLPPVTRSKIMAYITNHPTQAKIAAGGAALTGGFGISKAVAGEPLAGSEKATAKEQGKPKTEVPVVEPVASKDPLADKLNSSNSSSLAEYGTASLGGGLLSGGIASGIGALTAAPGNRLAAAKKGAIYGGIAGAALSPIALLLANKLQSRT